MLAAGATPAEAAGDSKFRRGRGGCEACAATVSIDEVVEAYDLFGAAERRKHQHRSANFSLIF